jgi:hypothetical protein
VPKILLQAILKNLAALSPALVRRPPSTSGAGGKACQADAIKGK